MKINDESHYIFVYKRAFSAGLEGVTSKNFSRPQASFSPCLGWKNAILGQTCYLKAQVCNMQTFKALNLISMSVHPPPQYTPAVYAPVVCIACSCIYHRSYVKIIFLKMKKVSDCLLSCGKSATVCFQGRLESLLQKTWSMSFGVSMHLKSLK